MNQGLIKNYTANGAVGARRIVKFTADKVVGVATANTDAAVGISSEVDAVDGGPCDVVRSGMTQLVLGGTVVRGKGVTSDNAGAGIALSTINVGGIAQCQIGIAETSGVSGDIIDVMILPSIA